MPRYIAPDLASRPCPPGRKEGVGRRPYPKLCFQRAGKYLLRHDDVDLVHALVVGRLGVPFLHAWCELPEDLVFDGSDNAFYDTAEYREYVQPLVDYRYDQLAAAKLMMETGNWGPWADIDWNHARLRG